MRGRGRKRAITWGKAAAVVGALAFAGAVSIYLTLPDVRGLATSNPASTAFMDLRASQAAAAGKQVRRIHQWVPYRRISPHLKRAVLVAEDSAFWDHEGIDIEQIKVSIEAAIEKGDTPRGASTITQQLAKNLYLSPSQDPLRKLRELIITRRLEAALPKARILELYLNVVEWGDGIWGAEAASRQYFGVPASALTPQQAALLAGALINPIRYSPGHPPARLLRRQQIILARMGSVEPPAPPPAAPLPESSSPESQPVDEPASPEPDEAVGQDEAADAPSSDALPDAPTEP
jgi:monofunctional biosynthetic peptidoglycan transglycosylase